MQKTMVWSLGQEDPLEKEMATHSSIPWIENLVGYKAMGSQRIRCDCVTKQQRDFPSYPAA